jgi:photosystem II stability/assembly factor-like uncharacterized protein/ribosomal protein L30/L7E
MLFAVLATFTAFVAVAQHPSGAAGSILHPSQPLQAPAPAGSAAGGSAISDIEWRMVPSVTSEWLRDVYMVSDTDGWAVGNNATLLRYNGTGWAPFPINTQQPGEWLVDVHMLAPDDGYILGWGATSGGGNIYHWDGSQWSFVYATDRDPNRLDAVAPDNVWVAALGKIYHWDGTSWTTAYVQPSGRNIFAIQMVSANEGWAVGANQFIAHYLNGTWTELNPSPAPQTLYDCFFRHGVPDDGWATGYALDNYVLHYNGVNWTWQYTPTFQLHRIYMLSSTDGWAIGPTTIAHYDGTGFTAVNNPAPSWLYLTGLFMRTATDGWIVGEQGVMLHSYEVSPTPTSTSTPTPTATPTNTPSPGASPTVTTTPTACTVQFTDVPTTHPFYPYIRCLACRGILGGYSDGTFRPDNFVTRGQLSKIVANAAGFSEPVSGQTFTDVPPTHPFYVYIERMARRGIIGGYSDGSFRPDNNATRGQISKIVASAASIQDPIPQSRQSFVDVPPTHPFWVYIERLSARGIIGGYSDGTFRPDNAATRGQVSKIVANAFFPGCNP